MVKVVDETATPAEREVLMQLAVSDHALRQELERHMALKALTDGWVTRLEHDLRHDEIEARPITRGSKTAGLALLGVGTATIFGLELWQALTSPDLPWPLQAGLGLIMAGALVLLVQAVYARKALSPHDRYKDVIR